MPTSRFPQVVDLHNDLLTELMHERERARSGGFAAHWLPQLRAGGVTVQVLPIFTEDYFAGEGALRRCLLILDMAEELAAEHADSVAICRTAADLDATTASGRIALILALEGLEPAGADLGVLRTLHRLGVRVASLTWNRRNMFADGLGEAATNAGLTELGVAAVAEMARLGFVVDVSHLSEAGFWHVHEVATRPYIASHSSCRAVCDHPRNLTDDQIRALASQGGVVGINFYGEFVSDPPTQAGVIEHIVHALEVAGEDHVALGPDYVWDYFQTTDTKGMTDADFAKHMPAGLRRPDELPAVVELLVSAIGEPVAGKVAGGNALRVLREVLG
ncbi:MAG TPA: dipeptidase [Actinomycetes bacterium]|nr:dipeptidase [Actinomycetes bacterium]